jgi:excisionase family DNA binding protein
MDHPDDQGDRPDLISTPAAAARLGVGAGAVRALAAAGELTSYRIGRLVKIDAASVEAYLARQRVTR